MMIRYCPLCAGRPYTDDFTISECPVCGNALLFEVVDDAALAGRPKITQSGFGNSAFSPRAPIPHAQTPHAQTPRIPGVNDQQPGNVVPASQGNSAGGAVVSVGNNPAAVQGKNNTDHNLQTRKGKTTITGHVSQYSSSGREDGTYRRLLINKIIDAVVYHQRFEDVLHRFYVRVDNGMDAMGFSHFLDIPVNVHGTIAGGMQITDNAEVEVKGSFRKGTLMATKISMVNNGFNSPITFQHSIRAILYGILAVIAVVVMIVFVANTDGNFFDNLKNFLVTWFVTSVVLSVLYLILMFTKIGFFVRLTSGKRMRFPIIGILLLSLILTIIFMNSFGIGASLSGLFSKLLVAIMPTAIIIIAIIFLIKLIFK